MAKRKTSSTTYASSGSYSSESGRGTATLKAPSRPSAKVGNGLAKPTVSRPTHDQIAKRAYEIWVAKGRPVGLDEINWREAERELNGR